jgi:LPXTG-motif cell wall-anchored protein
VTVAVGQSADDTYTPTVLAALPMTGTALLSAVAAGAALLVAGVALLRVRSQPEGTVP